MGALISGAVHGLRCPEEANLRAPESVIAVHTGYIAAGAELIETNTFGANRRKLARALLDDAFEEINSAGVRLAREAREVAGRDVFIAGSIGPLGELEVFDPSEHGPLYAAQAARPRGTWRRPVHGRDVLRPRRARRRGRGGALRLVAPDRGAPHVRRRGRDHRRHRRRDRRAAPRRHSASRRSGPTTGPGRPWRSARCAGCGTRASRSRRCPTSASRAWPGGASSTRTRPPTTSPSSPCRPSRSERGSSAAAAGRRRPRSRRSATPSKRAAHRLALLEVDEPSLPLAAAAGRRRDGARAGASARTSGSCASSSTRRRAARSTASSRSHAPCIAPARSASSTSTTTRWRGRG